MGRLAATFGGILVLGLVAGAFTEATFALGHLGSLSNDTLLRPVKSIVPTPIRTPTPTPMPTSVLVPRPTTVATPAPVATPTATTNAFVHLRASKSTSSAILTDLNGGTVVGLLSDSDAQWQQVSYNGLNGYIYKTYLAY